MDLVKREIANNLYMALRNLVERMEDFYAPMGVPALLTSPATDAWNALRYAELNEVGIVETN